MLNRYRGAGEEGVVNHVEVRGRAYQLRIEVGGGFEEAARYCVWLWGCVTAMEGPGAMTCRTQLFRVAGCGLT